MRDSDDTTGTRDRGEAGRGSSEDVAGLIRGGYPGLSPSGGLQSGTGSQAGGKRGEDLVSARGTGDGFVLRVDGISAPFAALRAAVVEFLETRRSFLTGHTISIEWVNGEPTSGVKSDLVELLREAFSIEVGEVAPPMEEVAPVRGSLDEGEGRIGAGRVVPRREKISIPERGSRGSSLSSGGTRGLFGGVEILTDPETPVISQSARARLAAETGLFDDADARVVYGTVRGGQRIESEHSVIVCGDVNSGAEIVSGGDIIVLGNLRGVAHAGAYEESGGGRFIFALSLQPTQLRIGSVISRGSSERGGMPEIARVDGTTIAVEGYQAKSIGGRR